MIYRFADCELDDRRYELRHGGEVVDLAPKALRLLLHLLRHRDRMVTRDELLETLWPDVVVSDAALSTAIKKARRAVGDLGSRQDVIATRRGVGLRIVAPVEVIEVSEEPVRPLPAPEPGETAVAELPTRDPFVGRAGPRTQLERLVHEARAGRGRLAVVEGEAGIGKTALLDETTRFATAQGLEVIRAYCWNGEGDPPFWLWAQVFAQLMGGLEDGELEPVLQAAAPWIALLVPELARRLPDLAPAEASDGEHARVELFDAVASVLARCASRRGGLVLALEDVQYASTGCLRGFQYLAPRIGTLPLLVIATRRSREPADGGPADDPLAGLVGRATAEWIPLAGLDREDLSRLVSSWVGAPPSPAAISALEAGTRGNPLLAREVVRALAGANADLDSVLPRAVSGGALLAAAPALARILEHRLARLPAAVRSVLEVASVAGSEIDLAILQRASGLDAHALLPALDDAVAAGVIEPLGASAERFRFCHALLREVLLDSLGVTRRTDLHRLVGEALEAVHAADPAPVLDALAHHFVRAAPVLDDLRAVEWARRAGERASALLAHEDAVRWFEKSLRALDLRPDPPAERRAELMIRLATALLGAGERQRARAAFREAAALARACGNPLLLAAAAFGFAGIQLGTPHPEAGLLLREAIAALGPADSAARVWGTAALLVHRASERRCDAALRKRAAENVAMAERVGAPVARVTALCAQAVVERGLPDDDVEARIARMREAGDLARQARDPWLRMVAGVQELSALVETGRLPEAERRLAQLEEGARTRASYWGWVSPGFRAMAAVTRGAWAEALALASDAYDSGESAAGAVSRGGGESEVDAVSLGAVRIEVEREQRSADDAAARISALSEEVSWNPYLRAALARAWLDAGRPADARAVVDELGAGDFVPLIGRDSWRATMWLLAGVCARLGDRRRLELLREHLLPMRSRCVVVRNLALCPGPVSHALGIAAGSLGRTAEACELLEEAAALGVEAGAPAWTARARIALACVLRRRNARGDARRVEALLRSAASCLETEPWPRLQATLAALRQPSSASDPAPARVRSQ